MAFDSLQSYSNSPTSVNLSWNAPEIPVSTGKALRRTSVDAEFHEIATVSISEHSAGQYEDKSLKPDSYFRYRLDLYSAAGALVAESNEVAGTSRVEEQPRPTPQEAPTVLGTYKSATPNIELNWGYSPKIATLVEYQIYRSVDAGELAFLTARGVQQDGYEENKYADHAIQAGHSYVYEIRGVDQDGETLFVSANRFRQDT